MKRKSKLRDGRIDDSWGDSAAFSSFSNVPGRRSRACRTKDD